MMEMQWLLPSDLLSESIAIMRPHGAIGNEGLALWFGKADGTRAHITHLVDILGPGFRTTPLYMALSMRAMLKLTDLADRLDSFMVGQIHSHPGNLIDLSDLDRLHGIRSPDYLSVVCPHYAQRALKGYSECGMHVFEAGRFRRMAANEVDRRISFDSAPVTKLRLEVPA